LNKENMPKPQGHGIPPRSVLLLALVILVYAVLFLIVPGKTSEALKSSGSILLKIVGPLSLAFVVMVLLNLFIKPGQIVRYLGKGSGAKSIVFSTAAGIISMGPIYAWYPLLKELREKGAADFPLAVFLCNRAVKPFLLPVMIAYFGWLYVAILTILTIVESIVVGYCVDTATKRNDRSSF